MSNTVRKTYDGVIVRDGQWTHRCPEKDCDWCVRGKAKRPFRRGVRHDKGWRDE